MVTLAPVISGGETVIVVRIDDDHCELLKNARTLCQALPDVVTCWDDQNDLELVNALHGLGRAWSPDEYFISRASAGALQAVGIARSNKKVRERAAALGVAIRYRASSLMPCEDPTGDGTLYALVEEAKAVLPIDSNVLAARAPRTAAVESRPVITGLPSATASTAAVASLTKEVPTCVVCLDGLSTHAFNHTDTDDAHLAVCGGCAERFRAEHAAGDADSTFTTCPICRSPFESIKRIIPC